MKFEVVAVEQDRKEVTTWGDKEHRYVNTEMAVRLRLMLPDDSVRERIVRGEQAAALLELLGHKEAEKQVAIAEEVLRIRSRQAEARSLPQAVAWEAVPAEASAPADDPDCPF